MMNPSSGELVWPKFSVRDLFDGMWTLTEVLANNFCIGERKFIQEIGENCLQKVKRTMAPRLVFIRQIASLEARTPFFDLIDRVFC
jgi:hypothetical protein